MTRKDLCLIALCYANIFGIAVFNASMYDRLGVHLPAIYISIVLDLAVCVVVCKDSMLNWLGRTYAWLHCAMLIYLVYWYSVNLCSIDWRIHLPAIYKHCPRFSSWCSGIQGIYAQLTGEDLCLIALCYANIFGVAVFNAWYSIDWGSICILYICIVLDLAMGVAVCKASMLDRLGRTYAQLHWVYVHCLYIYRSVMSCAKSGVAVFKASMLDWLGWGFICHG